MNFDKVIYDDITLYEILKVLIILLFAVFIAKIITIKIRRALKDKISKDLLENAIRLIYYTIVIIAFISVFPILGINISGFLLAGGIFAIIIGFASQSIVSNLIAGIFLTIERPIKIGDRVEIEGISGNVEEIRIMSTTLKTFDGVYIRMPNDKVFTSNITNYVANVARRFKYTVGIRYSDDADKAIEIIKKIIEEHPFALVNPPPQVFVDNLGESSVNIIIRIWAPSTEWYEVKMELLWKIKRALEENGIRIPFPQREIWFNNMLNLERKIM